MVKVMVMVKDYGNFGFKLQRVKVRIRVRTAVHQRYFDMRTTVVEKSINTITNED